MKRSIKKLPRVSLGFAVVAVAGLVLCGFAVKSYASKTDLVAAKKAPVQDDMVVLVRGMADVIDLPAQVADVMVADPSLVEVMALQSQKLYVVGVNYGTTNLLAIDDQGNVIKRLNIHVKIDDVSIQNTIKNLFPDEDVTVTATNDQIVLTGYVSTPSRAERIAQVVATYAGEVQELEGSVDEIIVNMLNVAGEQQVMLKVKIIEASRSVLKELGLEGNLTESGGMANITGSLATTAASGLTSNPLGIADIIYNTGDNGFGPLQLIIRALEESSLVNTLAEPNLTAVSGEQAGFLAGGELPVPTGLDQQGNLVIEFRPFGVALNFRPVVLSNDRISLQLETEVSSISEENSLTFLAVDIPGFNVRRAQTTIEMGSGGSLMIAGLIQSEVTKGLTELPGAKKIPILGDLISSDSFQREESEVVVIVTPYLVRPYKQKDDKAEIVKLPESRALAEAFAANIRRTYARLGLAPELFSHETAYGYLID